MPFNKMVAYTRTMLLAAVLFSASPISASPVPDANLIVRDDVESDWTDSAFVTCMKKTYPNFPNGVKDPNAILNCKPSHKRSLPVSATDLNTRDLPGLTLADPDCDDGANGLLPKNFMIVTDIRAGAQGWCNSMKNDLITQGIGAIDQTFNNAVTKTANELHGKKGVALSLFFALTPQGRAAIKAGVVADTALMNTCTEAITKLATKGQGCTRDINWYNAGKAKGETSTGARDGGIDISLNIDDFGYLTTDYIKP